MVILPQRAYEERRPAYVPSAQRVHEKWHRDTGLVTIAQVLAWMPGWLAEEFSCPNRGPHEWRTVTADITKGVSGTRQLCLHCTAYRKV